MPNVRLYPGMPATVMIQTIERTALDYLVGPLVMSFNRAFRQTMTLKYIPYRRVRGSPDPACPMT